MMMLTMIVGVITVAATLVTRMPGAVVKTLSLPNQITLPDGTAPQAFTQGDTWYAVVTTDDHILIYSRATGALLQDIAINLAATGP